MAWLFFQKLFLQPYNISTKFQNPLLLRTSWQAQLIGSKLAKKGNKKQKQIEFSLAANRNDGLALFGNQSTAP